MADMKQIYGGFNPQTLGIHLPLTKEEKELASIVYSVTMEEVPRVLSDTVMVEPSSPGSIKESDFEQGVFNIKFEASKKNLNRILELFEQTHDARERFVENFQHWELLRQKNIEQLGEIHKVIRRDKKKCHVGKLVGGIAGLAGGAALAGGLLFPPAAPVVLPAWLGGAAVAAYLPSFLIPTAAAYLPAFLIPAAAAAPALGPLAMGGGVAAGVGGAAIAGATAAEFVFLQRRMEEAKAVLKADQLGFQYVEAWFRHTKELIDAIEDVIGFNAMQSWLEDLNTSMSWFKDFHEMGEEKYVIFKTVLRLCVRRMLPCMSSLVRFGIPLIPMVTTILFITFWLNKRNHFLFDSTMKMREMTARLKKFLDPAVLQSLVTTLGANGAELIALSMTHRLAMGAFAGVGFVLNVATILLTVDDIQKGCDSKFADQVEDVASKLKEEYDVLLDVYVNLAGYDGRIK